MRKYHNQIIAGLVIVFAIYLVLVIFLDTGSQFDRGVLSTIRDFPLWLFFILCLTQISAGFFRFLEWHYYLGVIDARDKISLKDSLIIFVAGFTMVVSPGKVAELLKAVFLKMKTGVPVVVSSPVVIAERVVDGLAVILTLTVTLLVASDRLHLDNLPDPLTRGVVEGIIYTSALLLFGGLVVVQIAPLARFFLDVLAQIPLLSRLHDPLSEFYESSREIFKLKHVIPTTIMGVGVYLSSTTGFVLILWGFGLTLDVELVVQVAFIVGVASAVGALSFVPNGAGVTEVSNFAMLTAIVAPEHPSLTPDIAAAAALMQGFFHKWFRVVVGMGVAFVYRDRLFTSELEAELELMETERLRVDPYV